MRSKSLLSIALASLVTLSLLQSGWAVTQGGLSADDGGASLLNSNNVTPLGTGFVLQIGYFTGASISAGNLVTPFAGDFVALAGAPSNGGNTAPILGAAQGTSNSRYTTGGAQPVEIGAFPAGSPSAGGFATGALTFTIGDATTSSAPFPSAGAPLALRFFNASTIAGATFFNSVSSAVWVWNGTGDPAPLPTTISLGDAGLTWQSGPSGSFFTALPIPEPSSYALALVGFTAIAFARRFKRNQQ